MRYAAFLLMSIAVGGPLRAAEWRAGAIVVSQPWSRPTPPAVSAGAVYFSITNTGSRPDRLIALSTPLARTVEIHETLREHGNIRMRAVATVACAPGAPVAIAPGGMHVMLVGLTSPLVAGEVFPLTLKFRDAGILELRVTVSAPE